MKANTSSIATPGAFRRGHWVTLDEFWACEDELRNLRSTADDLSRQLRVNGERWMKVRNEEAYPIVYFCEHIGDAHRARDRLSYEGDPIDAEIDTGSGIRRVQITTVPNSPPEPIRHWRLMRFEYWPFADRSCRGE